MPSPRVRPASRRLSRSDFSKMGLENGDVDILMDMFSKRLDAVAWNKDKTIARLTEKNKRLAEKNKLQEEEIKDLKRRVAELESKGRRRSGRTRGYNVREFKDYPRRHHSPRPRPEDIPEACEHYEQERTADLNYCPACGGMMDKPRPRRSRTVEDMVDGRWTVTRWAVMRRKCKKCRKWHDASPEGVLPKEHFGVGIMSMVFCMRCIPIPYEKMQELIHNMLGRFIEISTLMHMCNRVADASEPLYQDLAERLEDALVINGDDTTWYHNKEHWYAWAFITVNSAVFHLSSSRSKGVADAILDGFVGVIIGDSHSAWNDVGCEKQRCLLHYFRDMYRTLKENQGEEFKKFFEELHGILKAAIRTGIKYANRKKVPKSTITKLQNRIDRLTEGNYADEDCKRYVKRLRRERKQLLTFLKYDGVEYHNNIAERALRIFALMRKISYGSRSKRGIKTLEILVSIYATCKMRGANPYRFMIDYLSGRTNSIPETRLSQKCAAAPPDTGPASKPRILQKCAAAAA